MQKPRDLLGLSREELAAFLKELGAPSYRAGQVMRWLYERGVSDFTLMTDLPQDLRDRLSAAAYVTQLSVLTVQRSVTDATVKTLLKLEDEETVEAVVLPHDYGVAACLSSQVGCKMGCRFCASTRGGLVRNLRASEMLGEALTLRRFVPAGRRLSHLVIMGTGEPLANLAELLRFLHLAQAPEGLGISYRNITVSTCGLVPEIRQLAEANLPITLAVSLHAPEEELRSELMPVNRKYPLAELLPTCKAYAEKTGRRVSFEYALIAGVNDRLEHARRLANLLRGMLAHVNLIPWNQVDEAGFERSSPGQVEEFKRALEGRGIETTVRREMGADIDAACGQLRRRFRKAGEHR